MSVPIRRHVDQGGEGEGRAIGAYIAEHRFAIGSTKEFLATLQAHSEKDLRPILAPWFPSLF